MYIPTPTRTTAPPTDSTFTPITRVCGKIICTSLMDKSISSPPDAIIATEFSAFLHQLNPSIKELLGNLHTQEVDVQYWICKINENKVQAALDGSVKDGSGTYAMVLQTEAKELRYQSPVDCDLSLLQSYRTELTGILATHYLLKYLSVYSQASVKAEVSTHVDNILAVEMNNQEAPYPGVTAHTCSNIDILQEIWLQKQSGIKRKMEWVEAHQDTKHLTRTLSKPAKLNCIADKDTGAYMAFAYVPLATPPVLLSTVATLTVKGVVIRNKLKETLHNAANCLNIQDYICKKTG
eukprot:10221956-Ditylum_brightwellii.AAC.2